MRAILFVAILAGAGLATNVSAAAWNGIEPFKTRRDEVLKIMGPPVSESSDGSLHFNVSGGTVQISFVDEKFVTNKKLRPELAGTVLQVILQHQHSSDTPESMKLKQNKDFSRDDSRNILVYRNIQDGLLYTFIDGSLKTTRYTFADTQLGRARR
ncbi:MAG: hypothetical protein QOK48_265 [Blastocatellia bacterium]|jgi:hypothetical protein|nr:hypothetical protein [Blastocatellia bacterium]